MAQLLGSHQPWLAFMMDSNNWESELQRISIQKKSAYYAQLIRQIHPAPTPYILLGWSFGALLAYAVAAELGSKVAIVINIDCPPPDYLVQMSPLLRAQSLIRDLAQQPVYGVDLLELDNIPLQNNDVKVSSACQFCPEHQQISFIEADAHFDKVSAQLQQQLAFYPSLPENIGNIFRKLSTSGIRDKEKSINFCVNIIIAYYTYPDLSTRILRFKQALQRAQINLKAYYHFGYHPPATISVPIIVAEAARKAQGLNDGADYRQWQKYSSSTCDHRLIMGTDHFDICHSPFMADWLRTLIERHQPLIHSIPFSQRLRDYQRIQYQSIQNKLYVPLHGAVSAKSNDRFPLFERVQQFMESKTQCLLLYGGSGSGKTTFLQSLADQVNCTLLAKLRRDIVWINLQRQSSANSVNKVLGRAGFTEYEINTYWKQSPVLIIMDGYENLEQAENLFVLNQLSNWHKESKLIISCRETALPEATENWITLFSDNNGHYQTCYCLPFDNQQMDQYVNSYGQLLDADNRQLFTERYQRIKNLPSQKEIIQRPLTLSMLTHILQAGSFEVDSKQIRTKLYQAFFELQVTRAKSFIYQHEGIVFSTNLVKAFWNYAKYFAYFLEVNGSIDSMDSFFGHYNISTRQASQACAYLLTKMNGKFVFIHDTFKEFFVARCLWDELLENVRKSTSTRLPGWEIRLFTKNQSILQFLQEWLVLEKPKQYKRIVSYLFTIVKNTKTIKTETASIAAANAITLLVQSGLVIKDQDFSHIEIPDAILSRGYFIKVIFNAANLRRADLSHIYCVECSFDDAEMSGVNFGETAYLTFAGSRLCFNPKNLFQVAFDEKDKIILHNQKNNQYCLLPNEHKKPLTHIIFNPQGTQLAAASLDPILTIWNVDGMNLQSYIIVDRDWSQPMKHLVFHPDGQQLAGAFSDGTICLWDSHRKKRVINSHREEISCLVYSPQGQYLASGSKDGTIKIHSSIEAKETNSFTLKLTGNTFPVKIVFNPDEKHLVSINCNHEERFLHLQEYQYLQIWNLKKCFYNNIDTRLGDRSNGEPCLVYREDGLQLAYVKSGNIYLWNARKNETLSLTTTEDLNFTFATHLIYRPDSSHLISAHDSNVINFWDHQRCQLIATLQNHDYYVIQKGVRVCYVYGNQLAMWNSQRNYIYWHDITTLPHCETIKVERSLHHLTYFSASNTPQIAYTRKNNNAVYLIDAKTGIVQVVLRQHTDEVLDIVYRPDGQQLATASKDKTIALWDIEHYRLQTTLLHRNWVQSVAYHPNGLQLAAGCFKEIWLWKLDNKPSNIRILSGHNGSIGRLVFHPSSKYLLSFGRFDKTILLWNLKTFTKIASFAAGEDVQCVIIEEQNGLSRYQLTYTTEENFGNTLHFTQYSSEQKSFLSKKLPHFITCLVYRMDGNEVVTKSEEEGIQLWNPINGSLRCNLVRHSIIPRNTIDRFVNRMIKDIACARYHPQHHQLTTSGADGMIKQWEVKTSKQPRLLDVIQWHTSIKILNWVSTNLLVIGDISGNVFAAHWHEQSFTLQWIIGEKSSQLRLQSTSFSLAKSLPTEQHHLLKQCEIFKSSSHIYDAKQSKATKLDTSNPTKMIQALHPYGTLLAAASQEGVLQLWDVRKNLCLSTQQSHRQITALQWIFADCLIMISVDGVVDKLMWNQEYKEFFVSHTPTYEIKQLPKEIRQASADLDSFLSKLESKLQVQVMAQHPSIKGVLYALKEMVQICFSYGRGFPIRQLEDLLSQHETNVNKIVQSSSFTSFFHEHRSNYNREKNKTAISTGEKNTNFTLKIPEYSL